MVKKKKVKKFEDLEVWQLGHHLSLETYKFTNAFPKDELYGLTSQIRRASVSVPANIVEGYYRGSTKELVRFLYMSRSSCGEVIYFLLLTKDLGYISEDKYEKLKEDYSLLIKKISAMINSLKNK